jgi:hypothetical protein
MNKKLYRISIDGCDDNTVFEMNLSKEEYNLLIQLSKLSKEYSAYRCQPTISIEELENELQNK